MGLTPHPDVVWVDNEDGIRMYDVRTGEFKEFNQAAGDIWRLVVAGHDERSIVAGVGRSYEATSEVDWETLRTDVRTFLQELVDSGILVSSVGAEGGPSPASHRGSP